MNSNFPIHLIFNNPPLPSPMTIFLPLLQSYYLIYLSPLLKHLPLPHLLVHQNTHTISPPQTSPSTSTTDTTSSATTPTSTSLPPLTPYYRPSNTSIHSMTTRARTHSHKPKAFITAHSSRLKPTSPLYEPRNYSHSAKHTH